MKQYISQLIGFLTGMGGPGVFLIALFDSSFLYLPLGVDIALVAASARDEDLALLYAALATCGSLIGTSLIWILARKGGEKGLARFGKGKRLHFVRAKLERKAGWMLAFAAIMPPPFPYRLYVAAAAVAAFPLSKMLFFAGAGRFARFSIEAYFSRRYGERIISYMDSSNVFQYVMIAIIAISIVGSTITIVALLRRSSPQSS